MKIESLLTPLDPAAGASPTTISERRADLSLVLASQTPVQPRVSRRFALGAVGAAAAATVAAVAAAAVLGSPASPSFAATPPPLTYTKPAGAKPAPVLLNAIADAAAQLQDAVAPGSHDHIQMAAWSLDTSVGEQTTSEIVESRTELWRGPDQSGRMITVRHGERSVEDYPAGQFGGMWNDRAPADAAALTEWLKQGHPPENGPAETVAAITDLLREQPLAARQRAALLRVLARVPGVGYAGAVTDRANRQGEAFSLDSDMSGLPTRHLLIVDPKTGVILAEEQMLTKTAGMLNVPVPSVISYTLYLKADRSGPPS